VEEDARQPIFETKLLGPTSNFTSGPTRIRFQLREQENVDLVVRDATGRQVSTLARGTLKPGVHEAMWDASQVPAGIYFVGFRAGEFRQTARLIVTR
jgi:hypothetical protein